MAGCGSPRIPRSGAGSEGQFLDALGDQVGDAVGELERGLHDADESLAIWWCRFQQPSEIMASMKPVSASNLRKATPGAVAGRCRWVSTPEARSICRAISRFALRVSPGRPHG